MFPHQLFHPQWLLSFFPQFNAIAPYTQLSQDTYVITQQDLRDNFLQLLLFWNEDKQTLLEAKLYFDQETTIGTIVYENDTYRTLQCTGPYRLANQPAAHGFLWSMQHAIAALVVRDVFIYASSDPIFLSSAPVVSFSSLFPIVQSTYPTALLPLDRDQTLYLMHIIEQMYLQQLSHLCVQANNKILHNDRAYRWMRRVVRKKLYETLCS